MNYGKPYENIGGEGGEGRGGGEEILLNLKPCPRALHFFL